MKTPQHGRLGRKVVTMYRIGSECACDTAQQQEQMTMQRLPNNAHGTEIRKAV